MAMRISEYNIVIVERTERKFKVICGRCNGSGTYSGKCDVCDGIGKVSLEIPSDWDCPVGILKCGRCGGSGTYSGRCDVCHGVGSVVRCFPRIICGRCGGSGTYSGKCDVCGGVGSVYEESMKTY